MSPFSWQLLVGYFEKIYAAWPGVARRGLCWLLVGKTKFCSVSTLLVRLLLLRESTFLINYSQSNVCDLSLLKYACRRTVNFHAWILRMNYAQGKAKTEVSLAETPLCTFFNQSYLREKVIRTLASKHS